MLLVLLMQRMGPIDRSSCARWAVTSDLDGH
jgi:hypothetical protein